MQFLVINPTFFVGQSMGDERGQDEIASWSWTRTIAVNNSVYLRTLWVLSHYRLEVWV